jgi:Zn-dependent protease
LSFRWIPSNPRVLELEDVVSDVFAIHNVSTRANSRIVVFQGQFLRSPEMVYEALAERFRHYGYVPILRQEEGQDVLMAYPAPTAAGASRPWVHLLLFVMTVISTLWVGAIHEVSPPWGSLEQILRESPAFFASNWQAGLPFATALLLILGVHEFGHYFVARHYGLDVSLPYFIPFPLNFYAGTLGAVIRIQSPFESKRALFDVGIAGPLAGLAIAIPVVILGLSQAEIQDFSGAAGVTVFSEPLLFQWLAAIVVGERGPTEDIVMNPLLMAGWLGFLVTALNLIPVSQLDGGHIAYAVLGRYHRVFAWTVFAVIATVTALKTPGFLLMVVLIFLMGIEHPPALNDVTPIGRARVILALLTLLLAATLITVTPFQTMSGGS